MKQQSRKREVFPEFSSVPIIDLNFFRMSGVEQEMLANRISEICHHVGFLIVTNHGIDQQLTDRVFSFSKAFFDLPLEKKQLIDKSNSRHFRGWESEGTEHTNNRKDFREQVDLWSEYPAREVEVSPSYLRLLGPNQWLPETILPDFRVTMNLWFDNLGNLGDRLMELLALGIGLKLSHFDDVFGRERMNLTKLIRYPVTPPGEFGVNAHHDTGFITILAPGDTPGLEIENAKGEWIPVPVIPDCFVINIGEMLQAMTGNYFVATPHRVFTKFPRLSVGYFHGPSLGTTLDKLSLGDQYCQAVAASLRHSNAGFMARRDQLFTGAGDMQSQNLATTFGDQVWNYLSRSYPKIIERFYPEC